MSFNSSEILPVNLARTLDRIPRFRTGIAVVVVDDKGAAVVVVIGVVMMGAGVVGATTRTAFTSSETKGRVVVTITSSMLPSRVDSTGAAREACGGELTPSMGVGKTGKAGSDGRTGRVGSPCGSETGSDGRATTGTGGTGSAPGVGS